MRLPFVPGSKFVVAWGFAALAMGLSGVGQVSAAETPQARIAVIGDADSQALSALIGTELSGRPDVALVEREDLSRLGDERKLELLAGSDAIALGKLMGADGLLFLNKPSAGFEARFTAVGLGYALFDDQINAVRDLAQIARSLAHRVAGYAPKLKLDPAKAVPLSVLNVRADLATEQSTTLERNLTLLLESRLAAVPEYVVLERRHAWSLGFEHALDPAATPLLRGAYLIDGTLSLPAGDTGELTVALRVRPPGGTEIASLVRGAAGDLPDLVDRMLPEIARATGKPLVVPTPAGQESREYLLEGLWGWRAKANQAALEALDSAELLGANIAEVEAARIPVLYALVDEGMEKWMPWFDEEKKIPIFDSATLAGKTNLALRAIREAVRYRDKKMESELPSGVAYSPTEKFLFHTSEIQYRVTYRVSKLLLLLDRAQAPQADELRQALRALTGYDPLHGHAGLSSSTHFFGDDDARLLFADDWAQTLEEELAFYRLVCTDKIMALPTSQTRWSMDRFCPRFLKTPAERQEGYARFVASLRGDPESRLSYPILGTYLADHAAADAAYRDLLGELWNQREELAAAQKCPPLFYALPRLPSGPKDRVGTAALPLLRYLLTAPIIGSWGLNVIQVFWTPSVISDENAAAVWADFNAYEERLGPIWKAEKHSEPGFKWQRETMTASFKEWFPHVAAAPAPPPASPSPLSVRPCLAVTRFWHPWLTPGVPPGDFICPATQASPGGGIWLAGYFSPGLKGRIFKIALPDFHTEVIEIPEYVMPSAIQVATDAIYTNCTGKQDNGTVLRNHLARYDFTTRAWTIRELPFQFGQTLALLHGSVYLIVRAFGGGYDEKESGLARYDWQSGQVTILASSRRRPGRNQFDDTAPYDIERVFLGPGDRPCIATRTGIFYIREEAGEWPPVFDGTFGDHTFAALDKTLVYNRNHELTVLDPQKAAPVHVMAAAEPFHRRGPSLEPSPWAAQAWWDNPGNGKLGQFAWHDDSLFVVIPPKEKRGTYELWCYRKDKGRQPLRIPLQFQMDAAAAAALPVRPGHMPNGWSIDEIEHPDTSFVPPELITTDEGLCLRFLSTGFWFLPYADIDGYLASGQHP